jgi:hypothetical protein
MDLRHWDSDVRLLGAQSLKAIAQLDPESLIVELGDKAVCTLPPQHSVASS